MFYYCKGDWRSILLFSEILEVKIIRLIYPDSLCLIATTMALLAKQMADLAGMGSDLHSDAASRHVGEPSLEGSLSGGQAGLFDHLTILVKDAEVGVLISRIQTDEKCTMVKYGQFLLLQQ